MRQVLSAVGVACGGFGIQRCGVRWLWRVAIVEILRYTESYFARFSQPAKLHSTEITNI